MAMQARAQAAVVAALFLILPPAAGAASQSVAKLPQLRGTSPAAPAAAKPAHGWSAAEIAAAKTDCVALLKGLKVDMSFAEPLQHGQCGTAQPIKLRGFGTQPKIVVQPPAVMNCKLAATLARWFDTGVQPLARELLKSPIAGIENAAAYDCRNRYGDPGQKLSEHAKANAIDIAAFVTEAGVTIRVAGTWGPSLRDLIAAAKLLQMKPVAVAGAGGFATTVTVAGTTLDSATVHKGSTANKQARADEAAHLGVIQPAPILPPSVFVHAVHASACTVFGTVLGPEANAAHNEHFHLDLASRAEASFCE